VYIYRSLGTSPVDDATILEAVRLQAAVIPKSH
jgi:hypothetical protein